MIISRINHLLYRHGTALTLGHPSHMEGTTLNMRLKRSRPYWETYLHTHYLLTHIYYPQGVTGVTLGHPDCLGSLEGKWSVKLARELRNTRPSRESYQNILGAHTWYWTNPGTPSTLYPSMEDLAHTPHGNTAIPDGT